MSADPDRIAVGPGDAAAGLRRRMLFILAAYVGLFLLMWLPPLFGFSGWLFLYPFFLLFWLPIEILAIFALVGAARAGLTSRASRRTNVGTVTLAGAIAVLSLPFLWFGGFIGFI